MSKFSSYFEQINSGSWQPLNGFLWKTIQDEGFVEDIEFQYSVNAEKSDFAFIKLVLTEIDKAGLVNYESETINLFNKFDIELKDMQKEYPTIVDFISYDKGNVYIIKYSKMKKLNEWGSFDFEDEGPQPGDYDYHNEQGSAAPFDVNNIQDVTELWFLLNNEGIEKSDWPQWVSSELNAFYEEDNYSVYFNQEGKQTFPTAESLQEFLVSTGNSDQQYKKAFGNHDSEAPYLRGQEQQMESKKLSKILLKLTESVEKEEFKVQLFKNKKK